jgi:ferredoxin
MKVHIDPAKCCGHAACVLVCESVFSTDDNGFGIVLDVSPPESLRTTIEMAVRNCPERAISVAE